MILEFLFVFFFSLLLVTLLVPIGRRRTYRTRFMGRRVEVTEPGIPAVDKDQPVGTGLTMLFFFLLIFPLLLLGNAWITPYGPSFMGVSYVPVVVLGFLITLLLAAVLPKDNPVNQENESNVDYGIIGFFGIFFFLFLFIAIASLVARYL